MPTAAKLVAAIVFAIVAGLAAHSYTLGAPSGAPAQGFVETSAVLGVLCGWFIMGPNAHRSSTRMDALGTGIRTSFTIALCMIMVFAAVQMFDRAMKGRYKTPMDALLGVFEQAVDLSKPLVQPPVLATLLLGGLIGGALAFWAGRKWN